MHPWERLQLFFLCNGRIETEKGKNTANIVISQQELNKNSIYLSNTGEEKIEGK